jgi:uncharacterized membrane protein
MWNGVAGLFMFMFIAFFHFFKCLETGSVSINAPIFRLSFIITATLEQISVDFTHSPRA